MKITSVEIWNTDCHMDLAWNPVLVRVNTDEGISGVGEVGVAYGIGHSGGAGYVKDLAERFLIGVDPMKTEKIWAEVFRSSFWGQGGGPIVYGGMSAIDIALWDIKGKALGQPIYQLLGGKTNERLRTYASQIQLGWSNDHFAFLSAPEEYAASALDAVHDGYDAIKLDPLQIDRHGNLAITADCAKIIDHDLYTMAYERVQAVREAVGDNVDIIIELHSGTNVTSGIQLARIGEEFECMYVEEPVHYMNSSLQKKVAQSVQVPLAAGERIYTRWGYSHYLEDQSVSVIQPDVCLVGGITEGKKVCDYASVYDVTVQFHVCGSPVSTAAALQLEAILPNFQIHELHTIALKQNNRQICIQDYMPVGGKFEVPDLPGLGVELNDEFLIDQPKVTVK